MPTTTRPHILLIGGGHAHVEVVRRLGGRTDVTATLVSPAPRTAYSGMLPGHIAGHHGRDEMMIDLVRLTAAAGVGFVEAEAVAVDRAARAVRLADGRVVGYDLLSLDVGSAPDLAAIAGAAETAIPVKPIDGFLARLDDLVRRAGAARPLRVAVIGGGVAATEIAMALTARLGRAAAAGRPPPHVSVFAASGLVPGFGGRARRLLAAALARHAVAVEAGAAVTAVDAGGITTANGRRFNADAVIVATGAHAPALLATLGLPLAPGGFLPVGPTLQAIGDDAVFAAGDCAHLHATPRPKAGVFAVRQGPVLAHNLIARAHGRAPESYRPQSDFLVLIATGDGRAIAVRGRYLAVEGSWILAWKHRIDRAFMRRYEV